MGAVAEQEGTLFVEVVTGSYLLASSLAIEIRDGTQRLVKTLRSGQSAQFPAGLYVVSALLPNGRRTSKPVAVNAGVSTHVALNESEHATLLGSHAPTAELRKLPDVKVLRVSDELEMSRAGRHEWSFNLKERRPPASVPYASFQSGGEVVCVSVPINWSELGPPAGCTITACPVDRSGGPRPRELQASVAFSSSRGVSRVVHGLAESGTLLYGASLLSTATELLQLKYSDPVGAALGGLLLHRLGALARQPDWVGNLARDFEWMPDGAILLSALHAEDAEQRRRDEGLDILLRSTGPGRRTMFSDALSLAVTLLRRWPDAEARVSERRQRLSETLDEFQWVEYSSAVLLERRPAEA